MINYYYLAPKLIKKEIKRKEGVEGIREFGSSPFIGTTVTGCTSISSLCIPGRIIMTKQVISSDLQPYS